MTLPKIDAFTKKVTDLPDSPSPVYSATEIKQFFQAPSDELQAAHNSLVESLEAPTAASEVGAKEGTANTNVQAFLDKLSNGKATNDRVLAAETRLGDAESRLDTVEDTSDSALTKANAVQTQVDRLVVDGDSSPAISQALAGSPYTTLKQKLDSNDTLLAEKAKQSDLVIANNKLKPLRYGELKMPSDFVPTLPCKFFRDNDGIIRHNMNFNKYKGGTKIYVTPTGNDTTGNGSEATPYRTLTKAVAIAIAGADAKYEIITSVPLFNRDEIVFNQTITNKTIAIISTVADKTVLSSNSNYTWTLDGTGTYKATRSGVNTVIDNLNRDIYGLPVPLKKVNTLADCQATKNSFYTDGASLWVHRSDEIIPTNSNTLVGIGVGGTDPKLGQGGVLYFENFIFTAWQNSTNALRIQNNNAIPYGEFCAKDCFFVGGTSVNGNGITTENVKNVYLFNCIAAYNQLDGFNYHAVSIPQANRKECFALEYNCKAYDLGLEMPGAGSNNASTGHESISILRIGTIGYRNTGATIIDINGCYSILYDCHARTPVTSGVEGKGTAYQFSSEDTFANMGKTYMYNCSAMECDNALVVGSTHIANVNNFKSEGLISGTGTINYI